MRQKRDPNEFRWQIAVTYNCDRTCRHCYTFNDLLPCPREESDVTADDIVRSAAALRAAGFKVEQLRFTGGDPALVSNVIELYDLAKREWAPRRTFRTYSHHWERVDLRRRIRMACKTPQQRASFFTPFTISPTDLGRKPLFGFGGRADGASTPSALRRARSWGRPAGCSA